MDEAVKIIGHDMTAIHADAGYSGMLNHAIPRSLNQCVVLTNFEFDNLIYEDSIVKV